MIAVIKWSMKDFMKSFVLCSKKTYKITRKFPDLKTSRILLKRENAKYIMPQ